MHAKTVRDLGALVRSTRRARGLTQAELAEQLGVSRDWVVRLENGHPRLEAQRVLDALTVLDLVLDVEDRNRGTTGSRPRAVRTKTKPTTAKKMMGETMATKTATSTGRQVQHATTRTPTNTSADDPFTALFKDYR